MAAAMEIGVEQLQEREQLLRFREGCEIAFEALFRRFQRDVYSWILRIVRDPGAAEDLTIETFFRIYQAHARFDPSRGFGPWARRIATHSAIDWLRRRPAEHSTPGEFFDDVPARREPDPLLTAEIRRGIAGAVAQLPAKLRVAVILAVIEERSQKEVADAMGITVAAVKLRVFRGLRKLRSNLEQRGIRP
jgi:RNA polymerase sigma-70 factor (ECF subfamily)